MYPPMPQMMDAVNRNQLADMPGVHRYAQQHSLAGRSSYYEVIEVTSVEFRPSFLLLAINLLLVALLIRISLAERAAHARVGETGRDMVASVGGMSAAKKVGFGLNRADSKLHKPDVSMV